MFTPASLIAAATFASSPGLFSRSIVRSIAMACASLHRTASVASPTMSRQNVEIAVRMIEAWNRHDREEWLSGAHPEIEWRSAVVGEFEGAGAVYRGPDQLRAFWDDWQKLWNLHIEITGSRDLGDVIVLLGEGGATGVASGLEVQRAIGYVIEFEDGLVRRARAYLSHAEALEAVGLTS